MDELVTKKGWLEERLNGKKEQLLEKELVLEEVSNLAEKLREQAATGRNETLDLAKRVNTHQKKIGDVTRKMMATVSELSMYQATSLKLHSERSELSQLVQEAHRRRVAPGFSCSRGGLALNTEGGLRCWLPGWRKGCPQLRTQRRSGSG